jgi:hypothetical protein
MTQTLCAHINKRNFKKSILAPITLAVNKTNTLISKGSQYTQEVRTTKQTGGGKGLRNKIGLRR